MFDIVLVGPAPRDDGRDADRPLRQPEHRVHRSVGEAEGAAARRARRAGQHREPPDELLGAAALDRACSSRPVDCVSGVGYDRAAAAGPSASQYHEIRRVVSNLGVFDFETPDHAMRLRSRAPGRLGRRGARGDGLRARGARRRARDPLADRRRPAAPPRGARPAGSARRRGRARDARRVAHARSATSAASNDRSCRRAWAGSRAARSPRRRRTPAASGSWPRARWTTTSSSPRSATSKARTDKPFGVNLRSDAPDADGADRPAHPGGRARRVVRDGAERGAHQAPEGRRRRRDPVDRRATPRREGRGVGRRRGARAGRRGRGPHRRRARRACSSRRWSTPSTSR